MVKVLRKYNKWILVIGGSLLMLAFLAPQAVQNLFGDPRKRVAFTLSGEKVRMGDLEAYDWEYRALREWPVLTDALRQMGVLGRRPDGSAMDFRDWIENTEHYFLLVREAEGAGLVGGPEAGRTFASGEAFMVTMVQSEAMGAARASLERAGKERPSLAEIDEESRRLFGDQAAFEGLLTRIRDTMPERLARAGAQGRLTEEQFSQTLARLSGILTLVRMHDRAPRASEPRVIGLAREVMDRAVVDLVVADSARFTGGPEPTDDEVAAHFDAYKSVKPGDDEFGVGYWQPAKVRLEWMEINRAAISAAIDVPEMVLEQRWRADNPSLSWDEFPKQKDAYLSTLKGTYADTLLRLAHDVFRQEAAGWDASGKPLGEVASLLAERVSAETRQPDAARWPGPVDFPTPIVSGGDRWLTMDEIRGLPVVGSAFVQRGAQRSPLPETAFNLRELDPTARQPIRLNAVVITERPTTDFLGNTVYFRVTGARAAGVSAELSEVRAQAAEDLKRLRAYRTLAESLAELQVLAAGEGLDAVARVLNERAASARPEGSPAPEPLTVSKGVSVSRTLVQTGNAKLNVPALRTGVMDVASRLDPRVNIAEAAAADRVVGVAVPGAMSVVVAMIEKVEPVTVESLRSVMGEASRAVMMREATREGTAPPENPFTFAAMRARHGYVSTSEKPAGEPVQPPTTRTTPTPTP
ncbi:MAG: hypothetical protein HRU70_15020 [Phycisphaeraceae bacterium]|nr:MAG: hypothetical protein HRU70_15020 [Phycisphaeraceae bacterium]